MTKMLAPKPQRLDLNEVGESFMEEYADVVRRLAVGDPVEREEVRQAVVSIGVSTQTLRADVAKLRRRLDAAAEIEEVAGRRGEAERLNAEAEKLTAEIMTRRREFEESLRAKNDRLRQVKEQAARLTSGASIGTQVHELRSGAKPEIAARILVLRQQVQALWHEAGDLRQRVPRLTAMVEVATDVREQFEEFRETGRYFSRTDKHGKPIERLWAGNQPQGTPPEHLCIAQCEARVERFDQAAEQLAAMNERINAEIPARVRALEEEIDRLGAKQLDPMAMTFGVEEA